MDENQNPDAPDEHEKDPFAGYTKEQLDRVSRFNKNVIKHAKELQKAVTIARKKVTRVRVKTD